MSDAPLGVALLGAAFMGRAHAHALRTAAAMLPGSPPTRLELLVGRTPERAAEAARDLGFARGTDDWRAAVADPAVAIFADVGPNDLHAAPTIAAARAGRHAVCEKPLGRTADEALAIWRAAHGAGVTHLCGFNYRFVPAIRHARELIARGAIGTVRHVDLRYLQDWLVDPAAPTTWRLRREAAGSGVLGDLGSHLIDLCRYLVGEVEAVSAQTRTYTPERPGGPVDVDDAVTATLALAGGAIGTLTASRVAPGRRNALTLEISGSEGSVRFALERMNELRLYLPGDPGGTRGFRTVLMTDPEHPFAPAWWPPGHLLAWEHTFVHELDHFLRAVRDGRSVRPHGADFEDGYRAAEVCDAILRSAASGRTEPVAYRTAG
ncbi:Gfo/Idh/MocA family protein [Patulibacter sp. S7RM1-6]